MKIKNRNMYLIKFRLYKKIKLHLMPSIKQNEIITNYVWY